MFPEDDGSDEWLGGTVELADPLRTCLGGTLLTHSPGTGCAPRNLQIRSATSSSGSALLLTEHPAAFIFLISHHLPRPLRPLCSRHLAYALRPVYFAVVTDMSCTVSPASRCATGVKRKAVRMSGVQKPKRACDVCHARKVKVSPKARLGGHRHMRRCKSYMLTLQCDGSLPCGRCRKSDGDCTYLNPIRPKGPLPRCAVLRLLPHHTSVTLQGRQGYQHKAATDRSSRLLSGMECNTSQHDKWGRHTVLADPAPISTPLRRLRHLSDITPRA